MAVTIRRESGRSRNKRLRVGRHGLIGALAILVWWAERWGGLGLIGLALGGTWLLKHDSMCRDFPLFPIPYHRVYPKGSYFWSPIGHLEMAPNARHKPNDQIRA